MQGYAGSINSEAAVYVHSQPASPTQECVLSPATSSMALFTHHSQAAANPNHTATIASRIDQVSHGATNRSQNPEIANQMTLSGSQGRHAPPPANQPARRRRKLITSEIVLEMIAKQGMIMSIGEIAAAVGFSKSTVAATLQAHANCSPPPKKTPTDACTLTKGDTDHLCHTAPVYQLKPAPPCKLMLINWRNLRVTQYKLVNQHGHQKLVTQGFFATWTRYLLDNVEGIGGQDSGGVA
ncbi:hypothetical protein DSO57_1003696 [Entomophthora muscae]|uniref:Uncharacterized protein n=1 Tax=Entomophthora muscae TaxID=34485 RepID=A0ACC2U6I2_9FUNG|nr:hypothetical protein DSO57_1003696 [Entomophthora muscae]